MDIKEQIAVMQGFADGKEVEFKAKDSSCWKTPNRNTFKPVWNWHEYYYRIKPEPPIQVELWGIVNEKGKVLQMYQNKQDAVNMCSSSFKQRVIKFICNEVPENAA